MPFFQGIILTICNLTFMVLHFGNFMRSDSETNYRIFFFFQTTDKLLVKSNEKFAALKTLMQ